MSDIHQHYCRRCRTPWEHDCDLITTQEASVDAHRCPSCGTPGWAKFYGNETHDEMCELEALLELSEDEATPEPLRTQADRDFRRLARKLHRPTLADLAAELEGLSEGLDGRDGFWETLI